MGSLEKGFGSLEKYGTVTFGTLSIVTSLNPSTDNAVAIGTSSLRFTTISAATAYRIFGASADANPTYEVGSAGFRAGAGGASAVDRVIVRNATAGFDFNGAIASSVSDMGGPGGGAAFLSWRDLAGLGWVVNLAETTARALTVLTNNVNPGAIKVVNSALTIGSLGSLIAPYDTAATETDAKAGNLNGALAINNADSKIYARTGGVWKGVAIAGFSIPNYKTQDPKEPDETICHRCNQQMRPGDLLIMLADKWYNQVDSREGLHAVATHLQCPKLSDEKN